MLRRSISRVLALAMAFGFATAPVGTSLSDKIGISASAEIVGDYYFSELEDGTLEIGNYYGEETELTIPWQIEGKRVTVIGSNIFSERSDLTSVTIPEGIVKIEYHAFESCENLTEVKLPDSVTEIEKGAFSGCKKLENIDIPESVTEFGEDAFADTLWIENRRSESPFVVVNDTIIDGKACKGDVVIPSGVPRIGQYAFYNCEDITSVTIPDSVTTIDRHAISTCQKLKALTIGSGVTTIGDFAFSACGELTDISIPDSVTSIGDFAFAACAELTAVSFPDSITSLGNFAFSGCKKLSDVTIPEGFDGFGAAVFMHTAWLDNKRAENPFVIVNNILIDGADCTGDITIPADVKIIAPDAFYKSTITGVTIPNNVTRIGAGAFICCTELKTVQLPDSITEIEAETFNICEKLESVNIPESVTTIGDYAFFDCPKLKSVTIPSSVKSIGEFALGIATSEEDDKVKGFVIIGESGSAAEKYAKNNELKFKSASSKTGMTVNYDSPIYTMSEAEKVLIAVIAITVTAAIILTIIYIVSKKRKI